MTIQLDLFGEIEADETRRWRDALTVLAEVHPRTVALLLGDRPPDRGQCYASADGDWAYHVSAAGLHIENRDAWARRGGWGVRPADYVPWAELDPLIDDDPRLGEIRAWSESLTAIDAWRDRVRPHELWSDPDGWHSSYIANDHNRPGWGDRLHAWQLAIAVCVDARTRLELIG